MAVFHAKKYKNNKFSKKNDRLNGLMYQFPKTNRLGFMLIPQYLVA